MDKIIIHGGKPLEGKVKISGAKNAALPIIASSILTEGWNIFHNVPDLWDINTIQRLMEEMGVSFQRSKDVLKVDASGLKSFDAPYDLVRKMRASVLVLGPLLAKLGRARVSLPGGCAIGARPINLHIKGLQQMGASVVLDHGYVDAKADQLKGADIYLDMVTVTGTENLMMAGTLAKGVTILRNAAREPEIVALADILNQMGARIEGAGSPIITITGVKNLKPVSAAIIPDRIEAGTFMVAAGLTQGDIHIENCNPDHLEAVISKLRQAGLTINKGQKSVHVRAPKQIQSIDIKTVPYPGFPTDMQAQFMVLISIAKGLSVINETIFENRFMHVSELQRMGADITVSGNSAVVRGVRRLDGAPVMASDLRASACLILAGLAAKGKTEVSRVYHLDRGYEKIEKKIAALGGDIHRVTSD
ncbi:MAG: UDP-N-acetylglucosamine 1-carboxyvinyltransferase [Pseudomonadota bacterium]